MNAPELLDLVARLNAGRQPVYLVGGAVRDQELGREPHDLDFTAQGDLRPLAAALANWLGGGLFALDEERGTYRVVLDGGRTVVDFASLRGRDLQADLAARDFTINAMARDATARERLIDPLGGRLDLERKILRACSASAFMDDPARTLRAARMSVGLGLAIEPETMAWLSAAVPLLPRVSAERMRDELCRMLESGQAAACLRLLDRLGLARNLLPELEALKGVDQSSPHVYPVWEHTLMVVEKLDLLWQALVDPGRMDAFPGEVLETAGEYLAVFGERLREHFGERLVPGRSVRALVFFAALYHDCAKPMTRSIDADGRIRVFEHEKMGANLAAARARALAFSSEEVARVGSVIAGHMRVHHLAQTGKSPSARAIYRLFRDTGQAGVDICLHTLADTWGTYDHTLPLSHWREELEVCRSLLNACWERTAEVIDPPRLVDGNQLMRALDLRPGVMVGRLLEAIREAQVEGEITTQAEALEYARQEFENLV